MWGQRKRERLRLFDEATAYARCHGERDENVRIVKLPPRRARFDKEQLRGVLKGAQRTER